MEQHVIASLQAFNGASFHEQVLRCEALQHHGGACFERNVVGQFANALGGHDALFAVAAWGLAGIGCTVTYFEVGDAFAYGFHNARSFHAQLEGHGQGVQTTALVHVNEVQANGLVANANFTGARLAYSDIDQFELFWTTVLVDLDS
jgi:hypothetical protein